tara:strand:- start:1307 stop:2017 length:711 start_codon:yes stop_codon:yes gene_type:complete
MAKVTVSSINVGDEIKASTFDDFIISANAVPGSINADNVMDEGIDRRNLAADSVQLVRDSFIYVYQYGDSDHDVTGTSSFQTLTTGVAGQVAMVGNLTPIECDNGDWIMVHCSFSFRAATPLTAAGANFGGQEVHFRLIFDDLVAGTVLTEIGGTERRFNCFMVMDDLVSQHAQLRYSCTIVAAFQAVTTSTGKNKIAVGLQGRDRLTRLSALLGQYQGGLTIVSELKLFARVIKR